MSGSGALRRRSLVSRIQAPSALLAYVVIRGCEASVLKWLQERGAATLTRSGGAEERCAANGHSFRPRITGC